MQLIRTLESYKDASGAVATIGNFDGVHLGHQMVIEKIISQSKKMNMPAMVITFEPSAKEFFQKNSAPARLTNFREKFMLLRNLGVDKFVCLKFNRSLANMPAEEFIQNTLVKNLAVRSLTVGDNFRFGKDRQGDIQLLQQLSKPLNYQVEDSDSYTYGQQRVSSTLIRELLADGDLDQAEALLGRPYSMSGHVVHGDQKGRTIGFPTANIPIRRVKSALSGVYAVRVLLENGKEFSGVANVGTRPTVGGVRIQLEVHLFNFSQDIYTQLIKVSFVKKIRDEKKFDSFDELKKQIHQDADTAQSYLSAAIK